MPPAATAGGGHCAPPIPLLVFSICHYSTYTLGPTLKISPRLLLAAWLPGCLPVRPTKGPTTRAPLPRHRAAATWPVLLLLRSLPPSPAPLVRRVTACLQPASCANFILHTTAPRSHYIAWLGLLQKKTNDGRSCTDSSEPFSFTLLRLQLWKKKPARSCRSQKNYHFCPFAFNRLISQPAAAANAAATWHTACRAMRRRCVAKLPLDMLLDSCLLE